MGLPHLDENADTTPVVIACVPNAIASGERERHFALARRLLTETALERADLPDGYAFRFAPDSFADVARFVENERKCCPFMTFDITVAAAPGSLWLRMYGPTGTRAVIDAELGLSGCCRGC